VGEVAKLLHRKLLARIPLDYRDDAIQSAHLAELEGGGRCRMFGAAVDTVRLLTGRTRHHKPEYVEFDEQTDAVERDNGPYEILEADSERQEIRRAISRLPLRWRTMVMLYYFGDVSQREIGAIFGVEESRVCQILKQSRTRLGTMLCGL
jgi:RNA polymerase sigma factor (sigma-70 family)